MSDHSRAATAALLLGLPGDLVGPGDGPSFQTTKAGGWAELPGSDGASLCAQLQEAANCGVCGRRLSLVAQAHAPLGKAQAGRDLNDRTVFVFGCAAEGCGLQLSCWRAFRVQEAILDVDPPTAATQSGTQATADAPATGSVAADSWGSGAGLDCWGAWPSVPTDGSDFGASASDDPWGAAGGISGSWGDPQPAASGGGFNFDDLNVALDGLSGPSGNPTTSRVKDRQASAAEQSLRPDTGGQAEPTVNANRARQPALAEFYIYAEAEPGQGRDEARLTAAEKEHTEALMAQYQQDEHMASTEASGAAGPSQAPPESWAGEAYEDETTAAVDATAMKYLKRLQRCPSQCVRYSFGGQAMWPTCTLPSPGPCVSCGEPRVFEMQLMAPLVHYLEEAAQWSEAGGTSPEILLRPPASWAWSTVAVYVCSRSCPGTPVAVTPSHSVTEEWVALAEE